MAVLHLQPVYSQRWNVPTLGYGLQGAHPHASFFERFRVWRLVLLTVAAFGQFGDRAAQSQVLGAHQFLDGRLLLFFECLDP
ncbi:hypothetical protein [Phormidesmis priestleyi]|uniref:hypothetical protein n=1 Tax=Phormidesmis priestleyi TaxID=268141 RepID=UPI0011602EB8|nr:hypothetical protein [Phormidesmis priestleyi]